MKQAKVIGMLLLVLIIASCKKLIVEKSDKCFGFFYVTIADQFFSKIISLGTVLHPSCHTLTIFTTSFFGLSTFWSWFTNYWSSDSDVIHSRTWSCKFVFDSHGHLNSSAARQPPPDNRVEAAWHWRTICMMRPLPYFPSPRLSLHPFWTVHFEHRPIEHRFLFILCC